jgi:hypothetical protein
MHGGHAPRGADHYAFRTGKYSRTARRTGKLFNELFQQPVQVKIQLYPESFAATMAKPPKERHFVVISLADESSVPPQERERILKAVRREANARIKELEGRS